MTESLLTVLIIFVTTVVSATFGFGSALFAMPILTLLSGLATATPLCGFVGPTISGLILAQNWRLVDLASAWRLVVTTLVGIPVGVALVKYAPGSLVARVLGVFLVSFGLYRLVNGRLVQLTSARWALPIGFIAGVLGGAYNTNGPPIVVYGEMRRWSPTEFRATLQGYFLPTGLAIWVSHGAAGLWTSQVLHLYALSLPGILLATAIGGWLNRRLPVEQFQGWLAVLLVALGFLLWL